MFFGHDPLNAVEGALKKRHWKYLRFDDQTLITGVALPPGRVYSLAIRHDEERKTVCFLCSPLQSPIDALKALASGQPPVLRIHSVKGYTAAQITAVCELLLHINFGMLLGSFERDQADGEIRYRIALPYRDARLSEEQANWCIDIAVMSTNNGIDKIDNALKGGTGAGMGANEKLKV